MTETTNFGFTRVGPGETLGKNSYAPLDADRVVLDGLLYALVEHTHSPSSRLGDPGAAPSLAVSTSGGTLAAGTTYYYRVSFLDRWGLETGPSPEASVTTQARIAPPVAPTLTAYTTGGGLLAGTYSYVLTYRDAQGGETTAGPAATASISGADTGRIVLGLPALAAGATSVRIYRAKPGQSRFYLLTSTASGTYEDNGGVTEDPTLMAPVTNSTNQTNSVTVTAPSVPADASSWQVYRTTTAGMYPLNSLAATVPRSSTTYTDVGGTAQRGAPRPRSATVGGGRSIALDRLAGVLPASSLPRGIRSWSVTIPQNPLTAGVKSRTRLPLDARPSRITAFFRTLPSGLTAATPNQVRFRLTDAQATPAYVELACADDSGYYVREYTLTDAALFQAEDGTTTGGVVLDVAAEYERAVALDAQNEYVDVAAGTLDPGTYTVYVRLRDTAASPPANDVTIQVNPAATPLATLTTTAPAETYAEVTGPQFTLTSAQAITLRVLKATTAARTLHVDTIRYAAQLTTLVKGDVTLETFIDGTPTSPGGDVDVTLWL